MATDRFAQPSDQEFATMKRAAGLLEAFRSVDPTMPLVYALAFLEVAMNPGQTVTHYADKLGVIRPICSRVLLEIGQKTRNGTGGTGYELVDSVHDAIDRRAVRYFLTAKGRRFLAQVLKHLEK